MYSQALSETLSLQQSVAALLKAVNPIVQKAVDVVADGFVEALLGDPKVNFFFKGTDKAKHKKHLANFVSMAFGKPDAGYNFSKEGVDNLTKVHAGMGITAEHFAIVAGHLESVMLVCSFLLPLQSFTVQKNKIYTLIYVQDHLADGIFLHLAMARSPGRHASGRMHGLSPVTRRPCCQESAP